MGLIETAQSWAGHDWALASVLMVLACIAGGVGVPVVFVFWGGE